MLTGRMGDEMERSGYKVTSEAGAIQWRLFPATVDDEEILSTFECSEGYYGGAGRAFCHPVYIRRTATRALATQFVGLDI
jgi:hypothetical protein